MRAPRVDKGFFFAPRPPQLPYALSLQGAEVTTARLDGGGATARPSPAASSASTRGRSTRSSRRCRACCTCPAARSARDSWVATFLRAVVAESNQRRPGGEAVLERMSEMLFVEVLRRYADSLPPDETGWLAAMRDPAVGRALALLHERPAEAWTLERLGDEAGLSRSSLHERFVALHRPAADAVPDAVADAARGRPAAGHDGEGDRRRARRSATTARPRSRARSSGRSASRPARGAAASGTAPEALFGPRGGRAMVRFSSQLAGLLDSRANVLGRQCGPCARRPLGDLPQCLLWPCE